MEENNKLEQFEFAPIDTSEIDENSQDEITSWYTLNGQEYFLAYTTIPHVPAGLYNVIVNADMGIGLSQINYEIDDIMILHGSPYIHIINDLASFWNSIEKFRKHKLKNRMGIILYGETGCGKTSIIYKIIEELKTFDGIAIQFTDPSTWVGIMPIINRLESNRPIICIISNIDKFIRKFGEENFLQFLDGMNSMSNIVYIATTNNINAIPSSIQDQSAQFDRKYEVKRPTDTARKEFLKKKLLNIAPNKYKIDKLVEDTKNFTMTNLREFFVSIFIFNKDYNETLKLIRGVKNNQHNSKFFAKR